MNLDTEKRLSALCELPKFEFKRNSVFERNIVFRYRHIIWINQFPSWAAQENDAVARFTRMLPLLAVVIVLVNVRTICFVLIELWARAQVCLEFLVCVFFSLLAYVPKYTYPYQYYEARLYINTNHNHS